MAHQFKQIDRNDALEFVTIDYSKVIPDGHPARIIRKFVDSIDVTSFEARYIIGKAGRAPIDVRMMLCVILYAIYCRIYSAHKISRAISYQMDFWYYTHRIPISHDKISDFICLHGQDISTVFIATIALAARNDLLDFSALFQDGFLLKANASREKNSTLKGLSEYEEKIRQALDAVLAKMSTAISDEEQQHCIKEERKLRKKIIKAQKLGKQLCARVKLLGDRETPGEQKVREQKTTINRTDPESELMKMKDDSYHNGYLKVNAVDGRSGIVVATNVSGHYDESHASVPLALQANRNIQGLSSSTYTTIVADSGFITKGTCVQAEAHSLAMLGPTKEAEHVLRSDNKTPITFAYDDVGNTVRCSMGAPLNYFERTFDSRRGAVISAYKNENACRQCFRLKECTSSKYGYREVKIDSRQPAADRAVVRYTSEQGKALYKRRSHCGETYQGDLHHNGKFRQVYRRGLTKAKVDLMCHDIVWNLRRIINCMNGIVTFEKKSMCGACVT